MIPFCFIKAKHLARPRSPRDKPCVPRTTGKQVSLIVFFQEISPIRACVGVFLWMGKMYIYLDQGPFHDDVHIDPSYFNVTHGSWS